MFLINHLNRNITDQYFPQFECIYAAEISLMVIQFCVSVTVMRAIWKSQLHRNIRLRLNFCIVHAAFSSVVRLYVMHYQVYGPVEKVVTTALIISSLIREAFLAYFCSLLLFIAIDRYFASRHWSWYEKADNSTILFFAALEIIHLSSTYISSYLLVYGYTSDIAYVFHCGALLFMGVTLYVFVYRSDYREMQLLKRGANIDSYSICRSYQLTENINLMNMMTRLSFPFGFAVAPEFLFYPAYTLIPAGIGYDPVRYFSIALYDVWITIIAVIEIGSIPLCQPQIAKHMPAGEQRDFNTESDTYFSQLADAWTPL